jgi:hypothetical protein
MPATNVVPRIEIVKEKGAEKVESYVWLRGERSNKLKAAVVASRISAN